jgi:hypothetical protein
MTPMKKLTNNIETFKSLIGSDFKEVNLNKSSPKEFYTSWCGEITHHEHVGVMNDFVKLFCIKFNKDSYYNMAFVFDYIDLPDSEHKISYSIKIKEKDYPKDYIIATEKMTVTEFKESLNLVNKKLTELDNSNHEKILKIVNESFIPNFNEKVKETKYGSQKKFKK